MSARKSRSQKKEKVELRPYDDDSSVARPSFAKAMLPPPATGSEAYKLLHPSLDEVLDQNPSGKRKISQSSQDNLVAFVGNTTPTPEKPVTPPFVPPSLMVSVGAKNKASSTVIATTQQDTLMETDASTAPEVPARTSVPSPTAAKLV